MQQHLIFLHFDFCIAAHSMAMLATTAPTQVLSSMIVKGWRSPIIGNTAENISGISIMRWYLVLFETLNKERIVQVMSFDTMSELAYVFGDTAQRLSNLYHGMLKAQGAMRYIHIYRE
jgi:hypothetical protein